MLKISIPFRGLFKSTEYWKLYWKERKIDWNLHYFNIDHPHRMKIIRALGDFKFRTVFEVGCGAGANLYLVKKFFKCQVGGYDVSKDAIEVAKSKLGTNSIMDVGSATDIYISNKGLDILLSDMCYIYLDKVNFRKALKEAKRATREGVVFCEFHSTSWIKRVLVKMFTGYHAYDYEKELARAGFYDIRIYHLTDEDWPGTGKEKLRCIITARP